MPRANHRSTTVSHGSARTVDASEPSDDDPPSDGRSARQLDGMRRVQSAAFALFEAHGYESVTVEAIARAAGVGPASVYRYFGNKEGVALWEEDERSFARAVVRTYSSPYPDIATVERAALSVAEAQLPHERERSLLRARILASHPSLLAALAGERTRSRIEVANAVRAKSTDDITRLEAEVIAGAICAAIEAALDAWARADGDVPQSKLLRQAFEHLHRYGVRARRSTARGATAHGDTTRRPAARRPATDG